MERDSRKPHAPAEVGKAATPAPVPGKSSLTQSLGTAGRSVVRPAPTAATADLGTPPRRRRSRSSAPPMESMDHEIEQEEVEQQELEQEELEQEESYVEQPTKPGNKDPEIEEEEPTGEDQDAVPVPGKFVMAVPKPTTPQAARKLPRLDLGAKPKKP